MSIPVGLHTDRYAGYASRRELEALAGDNPISTTEDFFRSRGPVPQGKPDSTDLGGAPKRYGTIAEVLRNHGLLTK